MPVSNWFAARARARPFRDEELPWQRELLSIELLKPRARALAQRQKAVTDGRAPNLLLPRLAANEKILAEFNEHTLRADKLRNITPAAEWMLDNFHLIEEQIRTARRHLPRAFSRQLLTLSEGTLRGFPLTYEMVVELICCVDARLDATHLGAFVGAYQEVRMLKLGELWAIPIMLRLALIENLRRVAVQLVAARADRDLADAWASRILETAEHDQKQTIVVLGEMAQSQPPASQAFLAEFWRRIQARASTARLVVIWIEERLAEEGMTVERLVQSESQEQAANQVSVGNTIGTLRLLDAMDWREFVESQSVVEQQLRLDPARAYPGMDFATRDLYRHAVERVAQHGPMTELEVAR
ncbi:MAG: cyclic beta 1-2 glucan synthetase, partial [Opitutaceae bacterium]